MKRNGQVLKRLLTYPTYQPCLSGEGQRKDSMNYTLPSDETRRRRRTLESLRFPDLEENEGWLKIKLQI